MEGTEYKCIGNFLLSSVPAMWVCVARLLRVFPRDVVDMLISRWEQYET